MLALRIALVGLLATGCGSKYVAGLRKPIPVTNEIAHEESRFQGLGGIGLFQESWRPRSGDAKAVLVIHHGLKDHADRYNELGELLARKGYAVYAFDMRGHGDSEGDRQWVDKFDDYVSDLETFTRLSTAKHPGKPVFLLGHSMGGTVVTMFVLDRRPPLNGVLLSAPALKPGKEVSEFLIATTNVLGSATPGMPVLSLPEEYFTHQGPDEMRKDPLVVQGAGPARTAKELLGALDTIGKRMEEIQAPLLILHGTDDRITNPDGSKDLSQRARSTDKTLKLYPGLYHDLLHEPQPHRGEVMKDILQWMEQRLATAPVPSSVPVAPAAAGTSTTPTTPTP
ncbi:MAG TPA: lysophospholipase [Myxococcaceae bacterium]|nr:lysophospholipase [Myxococcaceae bacterium]